MEATLLNPNNKIGNIQEVLPNQKLVNLLVSLKDSFEYYLSNYVDKCIQQSLNEHSQAQEEKDDEEYLTTKEACKLLKISSTTLWRWSDNSRITKYYVFGNPRFLKKEVLSLVKTIEVKK